MTPKQIRAAWAAWLASEEGRKASSPIVPPMIGARPYLEKRLERAFQAGVKFGATAVAEDVIAAMGKEKSS